MNIVHGDLILDGPLCGVQVVSFLGVDFAFSGWFWKIYLQGIVSLLADVSLMRLELNETSGWFQDAHSFQNILLFTCL